MSLVRERRAPAAPLPPPSEDVARRLARTRRRCGWAALAGFGAAAVSCLGPWGRFEHWGSFLAYYMGIPHRIPELLSVTYRWGPRTMPWFALELALLAIGITLLGLAVRGSRHAVLWSLGAVAAAIVLPIAVWVDYGAQRWDAVALEDPADKIRGAINSTGFGLKLALVCLLYTVGMLVVLYRQGYWARRRHPLKEPGA